MFLSSTQPTEFTLDVNAIKQMLDGVDPTALLPAIDTLVGKVQLVCTIAMLLAPLIMLAMGIAYLFFSPKEANYYFGYRTTFGMGSVSAWRRTQKVAGATFTLLGLVLTVLMLVLCMTLSSRSPMDMVTFAAKSLLWQGILAALAIGGVNLSTTLTFDYNGRRRKKKKNPR